MQFINPQDMPNQSKDFKFSDLTIENYFERRKTFARSVVAPNSTPIFGDQITNWYKFDGNIEETNIENFVEDGYFVGNENSYEIYKDNGPRNLGCLYVNNSWFLINRASVPQTRPFGSANEVWLEGSIILTVNPESDGYLLSGGLDQRTTNAQLTNPLGPIIGTSMPFTGDFYGDRYLLSSNTEIVGSENLPSYFNFEAPTPLIDKIAAGDEAAVVLDYFPIISSTGKLAGYFPSPDQGVELTESLNNPRLFNLFIEDGKVTVTYDVFIENQRRSIKLKGNKNIIDGNWHQIIINRPTELSFIREGQTFGENGALEIWVDGKLDARTFKITSRDYVPVPMVLFNTLNNPGVRYAPVRSISPLYQPTSKFDYLSESAKTSYKGKVRDYILLQSFAMTPHEINLHYTYGILGETNGNKIIKSEAIKASISLNKPTILTNSKKVLKLFWDKLLSNKDEIIDGLELDDTFNVYSYSVSRQNMISSSQTFNLNINSKINRVFAKNVKTAVKDNVFILRPGFVLTSGGLQNWYDFMSINTVFPDPNNYQDVLADAIQDFDDSAWIVNNLQYGGVTLKENDRVLLFGQNKPSENGIYQYYGPDKAMRKVDDVDATSYNNLHVYVEQGTYAGKTFVQTENVTHTRKSKQTWLEVDPNSLNSVVGSYPIYQEYWQNEYGEPRFINVNTDIDESFDVIVFMNYPTENSNIYNTFKFKDENYNKQAYKEFINNLKSAVSNGKKLYVSSPRLAMDLGIVSGYESVPQLFNELGDAQSAAISPFENGEPASSYFNTHRNNMYQVTATVAGLTNKPTYIMTDFVTYSPEGQDSDYHIKYSYRQFGLQEGDTFMIPGLTTLPETLNDSLPGFRSNQRGVKDIVAFPINKVLLGTVVTELANNIYDGDDLIVNPYDDYATSIAVNYGSGKIFVNCIEDAYAFSREDYNKAIIQNVTIGQNSETALTAAWQYSTKRIDRNTRYDFSDNSNIIGQTIPTNGGGGPAVQAQSHASNGLIRNIADQDDPTAVSDLYAKESEEVFGTTEIPVLSMTWLGLQWLAG